MQLHYRRKPTDRTKRRERFGENSKKMKGLMSPYDRFSGIRRLFVSPRKLVIPLFIQYDTRAQRKLTRGQHLMKATWLASLCCNAINRFEAVEGSASGLIGSFCEDPRKMGVDDFMRELLEFLRRFDRAQRENTARELKVREVEERG